MPRRHLLPLLLLVLPALASCGRKGIHLPVVVNQPPTLRLTQAPASSGSPFFYAYEVFWTAFDPDGRVVGYEYTIDPHGPDTTWVVTRDTRKQLLFQSPDPDSLGTHADPGGFHVFAIRAVDDQGARSPVVAAAFFSFTVAPTVEFVQPRANHIFPPILPPAARIKWTGQDPDGQHTQRPLYYKWRLFSDADPSFPFLTLLTQPDSLRRAYAPRFADWDSVAGDTNTIVMNQLIPGRKYVLAVVAFDEAGAYSPVFTLDTNLLYFTCQYTALNGPQLTVWNEFFRYQWPSGGFNPDPHNDANVELPYATPIGFQWSGIPDRSTSVKGYRWALDIQTLDDETPRTNEQTDLRHWSRWGAQNVGASVGSFSGGDNGQVEDHHFYVEAEDGNGLVSLGVVHFHIIKPAFDKDLLFVDDTRFDVDRAAPQRPDSVLVPGGAWPSAAELDTFLFARGGVRWRYMVPFPVQSTPGIFLGYHYDTLGTRGLPQALPLSTLSRYRHVVWYGDEGRDYTNPFYYPSLPMPMLRAMSSTGSANALLVYARAGGDVWLMGGGVAYNSLVSGNLPVNDYGGAVFDAAAGELTVGSLMWSAAHWQSRIFCGPGYRATLNPALSGAWAGAPDYAGLRTRLIERAGDGDTIPPDPVPPARNAYVFYATNYDGEMLTNPNHAVDAGGQTGSVLDTLYYVGEGENQYPVMTLYHGGEAGRVVFSGFPLWHWKRNQAIELGDFVLQRVWGLTRDPVAR